MRRSYQGETQVRVWFYWSWQASLCHVLPHWEIRASVPGESQLQQSRATQRTVHAGCLSVSLIHRTQTWRTVHRRCYLKILRIAYDDHVTNEEVCAKIQQAIGPHEDLLTIVKKTQTTVVRSCLPLIKSDQSHLTRHYERRKKITQTKKQNKKRGGKRASKNGQACSSPSPRGQWRTEKNAGNRLWNHLWCPTEPLGWGIDEGDNPRSCDKDCRIFNVRTDVNECEFTLACTDIVTESALKVDSWRKKNPSPHRGIEPASAAWLPDTLPSEVHSHLHRYIQIWVNLFIFFFLHWDVSKLAALVALH